MVGSEFAAGAAPRHEVTALAHADLDVSDRRAVRDVVARAAPDVIVHGGAWTNVDGCETDVARAYRVNALGTRNMAAAAAEAGAAILYISTDYVFDGRGSRPYHEFDPTNPLSQYGRSKLAGEQFVRELAGGRFWIVRSQWIYGFRGKNFVDTILAAARAGKPLRVVDDQIGCPTSASDLAAALARIVEQDPGYGTYHCSGGGACSWFELAREIVRLSGAKPAALEPMKSTELDRPAPRPAYSALQNFALEQTIGDPMRPWPDALAAYLAARGELAAERPA